MPSRSIESIIHDFKGVCQHEKVSTLSRAVNKISSEELLQVFLSRQPGFRLSPPRMLTPGQDMVADNSNTDDTGPIKCLIFFKKKKKRQRQVDF